MFSVIPDFTKKVFVIVNYDAPILAAVISSYFSNSGEYLPMFEFPLVTAGQVDAIEDEVHVISRIRSQGLNIRFHNALKILDTCEYLILAGLDENQKSYLDFLDKYNTIEVSGLADVEVLLAPLSDKTHSITCSEADIHRGLFAAVKTSSFLKIDSRVSSIENIPETKSGVIVIENNGYTSSIIAVNYALAVGADIEIIPMPEASDKEMRWLIERWQKEGNDTSLYDLGALLYPNVEGINFQKYAYATFVTDGAPYSLILKNIIPFSYIHAHLQPGLFIFNSLNAAKEPSIASGVVFSPLEFEDEETGFVINILKEKHYYVRELVGKNATAYNIDYHVTDFPYNILHFCSHGGQVDGYHIKHEFNDRDGLAHTIEYDEIVSLAPDKSEELIRVTAKNIWRSFDGYEWRSEELKSKKYPSYVFADMQKSVNTADIKHRTPKADITDSCAIKCSDFHYQAMFNRIGGMHVAPFIFNNTCWSWYDIALSFIDAGAKAYIGTLWAVNNDIAKETAERFYSTAFKKPVIYSLHEASMVAKGTSCDHIYMFWGLHLTTLTPGMSAYVSRYKILMKILTSHSQWRKLEKKVAGQDAKALDEVRRIIKWNLKQIKSFFYEEWLDYTS